MMQNTEKIPIYKRYVTLEKAKAHCPDDWEVVAMSSFSKFGDFYLLIPNKGLFFRSANSSRYGDWRSEMFMDGVFIGACPIAKIERIKMLYNLGELYQAEQYAKGYMLFSETVLGKNKINKYKEAARISHAMNDKTGADGHDERQIIRKLILVGTNNQHYID